MALACVDWLLRKTTLYRDRSAIHSCRSIGDIFKLPFDADPQCLIWRERAEWTLKTSKIMTRGKLVWRTIEVTKHSLALFQLNQHGSRLLKVTRRSGCVWCDQIPSTQKSGAVNIKYNRTHATAQLSHNQFVIIACPNLCVVGHEHHSSLTGQVVCWTNYMYREWNVRYCNLTESLTYWKHGCGCCYDMIKIIPENFGTVKGKNRAVYEC